MGTWRTSCGRQLTRLSSQWTRPDTPFRHALLREVVHDDLLPGQHARLHARFAKILEEHPELVECGSRSLGNRSPLERSARGQQGLPVGADRGRVGLRGAFMRALKLYERALELWDQVDDPESVAGPHRELADARRVRRRGCR